MGQNHTFDAEAGLPLNVVIKTDRWEAHSFFGMELIVKKQCAKKSSSFGAFVETVFRGK